MATKARKMEGLILCTLNTEADGSVTLEEANDFGQFEIRSSIDLASGHLCDEFFNFAKSTDDGIGSTPKLLCSCHQKSNDSKR